MFAASTMGSCGDASFLLIYVEIIDYLSMKKIVFVLATMSSLILNADIEKGTWKGTVREGVDCFIDAGEQTFEGGLHHPLSERIDIKIGQTHYSVHHPYSIDPEKGAVKFNHDLFEGVVPTATGAYAVQINMVHSDEFDGPSSFSVMEHNWKTGDIELVKCLSLKKVN